MESGDALIDRTRSRGPVVVIVHNERTVRPDGRTVRSVHFLVCLVQLGEQLAALRVDGGLHVLGGRPLGMT